MGIIDFKKDSIQDKSVDILSDDDKKHPNERVTETENIVLINKNHNSNLIIDKSQQPSDNESIPFNNSFADSQTIKEQSFANPINYDSNDPHNSTHKIPYKLISIFKNSVPTSKIVFILAKQLLQNFESIQKNNCIFILDEFQDRKKEVDYIFSLLRELINKKHNICLILNTLKTSSEHNQEFKGEFIQTEITRTNFKIKPIYIGQRSIEQHYNTFCEVFGDILKIENKKSQSPNGPKTTKENHILVFFSTFPKMSAAYKNFMEDRSQKPEFANCECHMVTEVNEVNKITKMFEQDSTSRLIIFTIKIFQTTFTLKGLKYVIDFGYIKRKTFDSKSCFYTKQVSFISQQIANQRMGRIGRLSDGYCFRVYSEDDFDNFEKEEKPEAQLNYSSLSFLKSVKMMAQILKNSHQIFEQTDIQISEDFYKSKWLYQLTTEQQTTINQLLKEYQMIENNELKISFTRSHLGMDIQNYALFKFSKECNMKKEIVVMDNYLTTIRPLVLKNDTFQYIIAQKKLCDLCFNPDGDLLTLLEIVKTYLVNKNDNEIEIFCVEYNSRKEMIKRFQDRVAQSLKTRQIEIGNLNDDIFKQTLRRLIMRVYYRNLVIRIPHTDKFYSISRGTIVLISDDSFYKYDSKNSANLEYFIYLTVTKNGSHYYSDFIVKIVKEDFEFLPQDFRILVEKKITIFHEKQTDQIFKKIKIASAFQFSIKNYFFHNSFNPLPNDLFLEFDGENALEIIDCSDGIKHIKKIENDISQFVGDLSNKTVSFPIENFKRFVVVGEGFLILDVLNLGEFNEFQVISKPGKFISFSNISNFVDKIYSKKTLGKRSLIYNKITSDFEDKINDENCKDVKLAKLSFKTKTNAIKFFERWNNVKNECSNMDFKDLIFKPIYLLNDVDYCTIGLTLFANESLKNGYIASDDHNILNSIIKILKNHELNEPGLFKFAKRKTSIELQNICDAYLTNKDIKQMIIKTDSSLENKFKVILKYGNPEYEKPDVWWILKIEELLKSNQTTQLFYNITISHAKNTGKIIAKLKIRKLELEKFENFFSTTRILAGGQKVYLKKTFKKVFFLSTTQNLQFEGELKALKEMLVDKSNNKLDEKLQERILRITDEKNKEKSSEKKIIWAGEKYKNLLLYFDTISSSLNDFCGGISVYYENESKTIIRKLLSQTDNLFKQKHKDMILKHRKIENRVDIFGKECHQKSSEYLEEYEKVRKQTLSFIFQIKPMQDSIDLIEKTQQFFAKIKNEVLWKIEIDYLDEQSYKVVFCKPSFDSNLIDESVKIRQLVSEFLHSQNFDAAITQCHNCQGFLEIIANNCEHSICCTCYKHLIETKLDDFENAVCQGIGLNCCKNSMVLIQDVQKMFTNLKIEQIFAKNQKSTIFQNDFLKHEQNLKSSLSTSKNNDEKLKTSVISPKIQNLDLSKLLQKSNHQIPKILQKLTNVEFQNSGHEKSKLNPNELKSKTCHRVNLTKKKNPCASDFIEIETNNIHESQKSPIKKNDISDTQNIDVWYSNSEVDNIDNRKSINENVDKKISSDKSDCFAFNKNNDADLFDKQATYSNPFDESIDKIIDPIQTNSSRNGKTKGLIITKINKNEVENKAQNIKIKINESEVERFKIENLNVFENEKSEMPQSPSSIANSLFNTNFEKTINRLKNVKKIAPKSTKMTIISCKNCSGKNEKFFFDQKDDYLICKNCRIFFCRNCEILKDTKKEIETHKCNK